MDILKGGNILEFAKGFPDDASFKVYLAQEKWSTSFICPKCAHTKRCEKAGHKYHCYSCGGERNGQHLLTEGGFMWTSSW